jgi:hypothetical protein
LDLFGSRLLEGVGFRSWRGFLGEKRVFWRVGRIEEGGNGWDLMTIVSRERL